MIPTYDVRLVILSVVIAVIASYTALDLAGRVTATKGLSRKVWLAGGATGMGIGIWSMHFVGMLAYKLPVPIAYDIPTVLVSMVAAIIASGLALYIASRETLGWLALLAGGTFMGVAIASMHYIGMAAIRMNAVVHYEAKMVTLSLAIAIGASIAALWLSFQLRGDNTLTAILQKLGSASVMGVAIAGMHYTGMAAATMLPAPELVEPSSDILGTSTLAVAIAITTLIILALTLIASLYERRLDEERRQLAAIVESSNDAIISSTMEGIITSWNAGATKLYGYSAAEAKHRHLSLMTPPNRQDELGEIFERLKRGEFIESLETVRVSKSGQLIDVSLTLSAIKNAAGKVIGASAIARDIRERKQAEQALQKAKEKLEIRVEERTAELVKANVDLQAEIAERRQTQLALAATNNDLQKSESRFRSLVANVPGVIYRCQWDWDWTLDFISDAIGEIAGYPASDFITNRVRTYSSIIYSEDREKVERLVREAVEQQKPYVIEYRILHADGSIRWVYEKGQGHFGEDGKAVWLDGVIFDITERKLADEKIRASEELFRLLVEGVKDYAILMLDPNGYITTWNAGAERIKGYKAEEIIGQHFSRFYSPEDLASGKPQYELEIATATGKYEEEGWRVRKDGSYFWANVVITALQDEAGNLRGFSKVSRDVTARKRDEQRLRKWADIFQHAGQGLIISDPDSPNLEMMNPALAKMHGYAVEELTGLPIPTIIAPERVDETFEQIRLAYQKKQHSFETKHVRKNKTVFPVLVESTTVRDSDGKILYGIFNIQDITQRKQAEEEILNALERERELAEIRSRFITMTSHEFRTPLATILSSTELLEYYSHKLPDNEKKELFRQIETATKRMTQLLDDVLAINKAEAGKIQLKPAPLNLEKFCRELVSEMQLSAGKKHEIVFAKSGDCTHAVIDEKLLRHALANLLDNALKYSPAGGIVEFSLACDNSRAIFQVKDSGIGIPLEDREKLFEAFHRAQNVGNISGTGLGLSIVKRMVDLHGGSIAADSEVGVGTTFTVTIPLNSAGEQNARVS